MVSYLFCFCFSHFYHGKKTIDVVSLAFWFVLVQRTMHFKTKESATDRSSRKKNHKLSVLYEWISKNIKKIDKIIEIVAQLCKNWRNCVKMKKEWRALLLYVYYYYYRNEMEIGVRNSEQWAYMSKPLKSLNTLRETKK